MAVTESCPYINNKMIEMGRDISEDPTLNNGPWNLDAQWAIGNRFSLIPPVRRVALIIIISNVHILVCFDLSDMGDF